MKNFCLGFIIGGIILGGVAFAASRMTLQNGAGEEVGTTANPLTIQIN